MTIDLGLFYIPFVIFVMTAFSNAVNLTDGLDGLASGITALVAFFMVIASMAFGYTDQPVLFGAVAGGCLGFLMFNRNPAKIFMGDTGSMALGGVSRRERCSEAGVPPCCGRTDIRNRSSVCIMQVTYYKKTKKRIFKMAPIHHHFELCGIKEKNVVFMFWGFAAVCCIIAIVLMNI